MSYATRADMIAAFGEDELIELTDRADPPADAIDEDVLASALDAAGAEIDGYVARVATLPLTVVPPVLRQIAVAIARYRLSTDQSEGRVRLDYEDAGRKLVEIAKGVIVLDLPATDGADAAIQPRVRGTSAPRRVHIGGEWP